MSTINGDEKAAQHADDQVDHSEATANKSLGGKLQQHQQQQRYDRNQQLHFTQV